MKKEKVKDIFETKCWLNDIMVDPYQVIAELFSSSECYHLRGVIKKLIQCATSPKIYSDKPPADVILYMRMISSTIRAAYALKDKKNCEIVVDQNDLFNNKYYRSHYMFTDSWTDFPRFLTKKEYRNPYSVFRKFFKYQSLDMWLTIWKDIIDGALCPEEARFFINEIAVYTHLVKLIEAAHLIDVREVVHVRGHLKNRVVENY